MRTVASVDYSGCIACTACIGACPVEAIILKDGHAKVKYSECINCSTCIDICPVGTIEQRMIEE